MGPMSDPECISALNSQPIVLIPKLKEWIPEPVDPCKSEPIDVDDVDEILEEDNIENPIKMIEVIDAKMINQNFEEMQSEQSKQDENSSPNIKSETTEDPTFQHPETLFSNSTSPRGEENRKCPICGRILSSIRNLRRHIEVHKQIKSYFCNECDASFLRSDYLTRHQKVHIKETTFVCHYCHITFTRKCNLYKHIRRIHFGDLPFACTLCKKSFAKKEHLKEHRLTHNIEKPFECDHCHKSFSDKSTLRAHITIHTGKRPFVCDICGANFRMKKILTRHKFKHTGEKPYICTDCQSGFTRAYNLNNHLKTKYNCVLCGGTFNCKKGLKVHLCGLTSYSVEGKELGKSYENRLFEKKFCMQRLREPE